MTALSAPHRLASVLAWAALLGGQAGRRLGLIGRHFLARIDAFLDSLGRHRRGTWMLLFAAIYIVFWIVGGYLGLSNGVGRGLLVSLVSAPITHLLFPLRPPTRSPT